MNVQSVIRFSRVYQNFKEGIMKMDIVSINSMALSLEKEG